MQTFDKISTICMKASALLCMSDCEPPHNWLSSRGDRADYVSANYTGLVGLVGVT